MSDMPKNPFSVVEYHEDTMVKVKDGDRDKMEDAKRYLVRYIVGESAEKRFVDSGKDNVEPVEGKTVYTVDSIHRLPSDPFHYDASKVVAIAGQEVSENMKGLKRADACEEHELIEVTFESPGVECCAMTKEEADKTHVPVQFLAGYMLGKSDGLFKVALSKTVLDSGKEYYDNIHVIPEAVVKSWTCLE